jgi:hypothetical protein
LVAAGASNPKIGPDQLIVLQDVHKSQQLENLQRLLAR